MSFSDQRNVFLRHWFVQTSLRLRLKGLHCLPISLWDNANCYWRWLSLTTNTPQVIVHRLQDHISHNRLSRWNKRESVLEQRLWLITDDHWLTRRHRLMCLQFTNDTYDSWYTYKNRGGSQELLLCHCYFAAIIYFHHWPIFLHNKTKV